MRSFAFRLPRMMVVVAGLIMTLPSAGLPAAHDEPAAIRKSPLSAEQKIAHLLNRITYGPTPGAAEAVQSLGLSVFIEQQLSPSNLDDSELAERLEPLKSIHMSADPLGQLFPRGGVVRNMIDAGLITREQARGRRFGQASTSSGGSRRRSRWRGANPIYQPISRLPQPVELPGRLGRNRPPILGINPQQLIVAQMQAAKLIRAVHSERQLEEIMVDFWMNHFNVFMAKGIERVLVPSYEREVIRPRAMGKFRDLLGATAHSPAMLFYLDNFQSVAPDSFLGRRRNRGLNENYARELMELHTLGVDGGYTQQDVVEVARVFTGWTFLRRQGGGRSMMGPATPQGEQETEADVGFRFLRAAHAPGNKKVLNHTIRAGGVKEGEQVLDLLARHPSTARFIAAKLVRRFVADDPPAMLAEKVSQTYRKTDGDIRAMLRTILYSPEFWSEDSFQAKTRKPLELVAGTIRALGGELTPTPPLLASMERMGEPLYLCRPPTGYADVADAWLNSGTLLSRWKFAVGVATGNLPGATFEIPDAPNGGSFPKALAMLLEEFLPVQLSNTTRANIERAAAKRLTQRANPEAPLGESEMRYLAGLVLGSPEFQRR